MRLLLYLLPPAALLALGTALWLQRSPRRAAIATLKAATAGLKPSTAIRSATSGLAVPVRSQGASRERAQAQVVDPVAAAIARLARRLIPPPYAAGAQRRLTLAGKDRPVDLDRFLAMRLVSVVLVVPAFFLIVLASLPGVYGLLCFFLVTAVLGLGPEAFLNRALAERKEKVRHDLPGMLELLMISVEAGLGFGSSPRQGRHLGTWPAR